MAYYAYGGSFTNDTHFNTQNYMPFEFEFFFLFW